MRVSAFAPMGKPDVDDDRYSHERDWSIGSGNTPIETSFEEQGPGFSTEKKAETGLLSRKPL